MYTVGTHSYIEPGKVLLIVQENKYVCHPSRLDQVQRAVDKINRAEQRAKVFARKPQG